ncbi:MAG: radical SAM protein [Candidatus Scalindua sp. AMX11]|nr:MAG: radical SAM protein [Candidatus Scalindua sp.]NOG84139.1 radical SAM protein [Planctomycetota bacterium]RZV98953.1 MAG: radical SAM protein [Candidatus Scalindua sp. SCAELEC01]TDE66856.1 MAG: radical SAM protein [Candidatus Scalindua sp. AMX11]GJQ57656.1 MAG: hypothetical protein SCALA701_04570 [Candidatus Scalindua sp.]
MDKYRIDSHKLIYHTSRVNEWLNGENIYPIYMEISPVGFCNHRCSFCALDFMKYKKRYLDTHILLERLSELATLGIKSVMYAGEGEPLLHEDIIDIINHTKKVGIDVALTTNGVKLSESFAKSTLDNISWIKVSINAGTRDTYAKIHRCRPDDFDKVIENMSRASKIKRENGYSCTLGMQLLLLPENQHEIVLLAERARDIGMNYLVIKPYSQHLFSDTDKYRDIKYRDYTHLAKTLSSLTTKEFHVIFRINTMEKWDNGERSYENCQALPFWSYIDAGGGVWGCSAYLGDERFLYDNVNERSFREIWEGEKRAKSLQWVQDKLDVSECRVNCRMDEVNRYLWELKHPLDHVNFI